MRIKNRKSVSAFLCIFFTAALTALHTACAVTVWTGNGDGNNWFDSANWDSGVPGSGQDALINSGSIMLTNSTAPLHSLTMAGGTLTFSNWTTKLSALNVLIQSGAKMTHVQNSAIETNEFGEWPTYGRVYITCTNFVLETGGSLDTKGLGFLGADPGVGSLPGYGPGGSLGTGGHYNGGNSASVDGGGGGGGRIALWYRVSESNQQTILADPDNAQANIPRFFTTNDLSASGFMGSWSVEEGLNGRDPLAEPGTAMFIAVPPPAGLIFFGH